MQNQDLENDNKDDIEVFPEMLGDKKISIGGKDYNGDEFMNFMETADEKKVAEILVVFSEYAEEKLNIPADKIFKNKKLYDHLNELVRKLPVKMLEKNQKDIENMLFGERYQKQMVGLYKAAKLDLQEVIGHVEADVPEQAAQAAEEVQEEMVVELEDETENLDQASVIVLVNCFLGIPEKKYKKKKGKKLKKSPLHVRMLKSILLIFAKVLAVTAFKNIGQHVKLYLLNDLLAKIEREIKRLVPKYKGPLRDQLMKLKEKVKQMILKERLGKNFAQLKNPKSEENNKKENKNNDTENRDDKKKEDTGKKEELNSKESKEASTWEKIKGFFDAKSEPGKHQDIKLHPKHSEHLHHNNINRNKEAVSEHKPKVKDTLANEQKENSKGEHKDAKHHNEQNQNNSKSKEQSKNADIVNDSKANDTKNVDVSQEKVSTKLSTLFNDLQNDQDFISKPITQPKIFIAEQENSNSPIVSSSTPRAITKDQSNEFGRDN